MTNKHSTPAPAGACPVCWRYGKAVPLQPNRPCTACQARALKTTDAVLNRDRITGKPGPRDYSGDSKGART